MDRGNWSAQGVKQINVVDQVQVNRASARLAAPIDVKIVIRFEEPRLRLNGGDVTEFATLNDFNSLSYQRVIAPMMACQKRNACGFGGGKHPASFN